MDSNVDLYHSYQRVEPNRRRSFPAVGEITVHSVRKETWSLLFHPLLTIFTNIFHCEHQHAQNLNLVEIPRTLFHSKLG
ncbi:hypothetical protein VNO80_10190 [Phaseolus coccineus]|uniref:Uncharacterized protein n=1 Tax=Phaseolus coccineus TaxID=3886 RepID=A0AAN9NCZ3_PHACN